MFLKRAHHYRNVFDPSIGFMRGKSADGAWISPFDSSEPYYKFMMKEASIRSDISRLMDQYGKLLA
jgi:putative alpha-1,2-mannosidase